MGNPRKLTYEEEVKLQILNNFIDWNREQGALKEFQVAIQKQRARIYVMEAEVGKNEISDANLKYTPSTKKSLKSEPVTTELGEVAEEPRTYNQYWVSNDDYEYRPSHYGREQAAHATFVGGRGNVSSDTHFTYPTMPEQAVEAMYIPLTEDEMLEQELAAGLRSEDENDGFEL